MRREGAADSSNGHKVNHLKVSAASNRQTAPDLPQFGLNEEGDYLVPNGPSSRRARATALTSGPYSRHGWPGRSSRRSAAWKLIGPFTNRNNDYCFSLRTPRPPSSSRAALAPPRRGAATDLTRPAWQSASPAGASRERAPCVKRY